MVKIDRNGESKLNNQGERMTIIRYSNWNDVDIIFDDGVVITNRSYSGFKKGDIRHPIRYEESIAYYIECVLGINLYDVWNFKVNNELNISPYDTSYGSNKKVWFYCLDKKYHNDYDGYETAIFNFYKGNRCPYCVNKKIHPNDSFAKYYINNLNENFLDKYWNWNKNNELGINPWDISPNSHTKIWLHCQNKDYHNDFGGYYINCNTLFSSFKDYDKMGCPYCNCKTKPHPKDSFAQYHIDNTDKDFLDKYWSSKNILNPWEITTNSKKSVWLYCQKHDYHNYNKNGEKIGYNTIVDNFTSNNTRCSFCGTSGEIHYKDSLAYKYTNIAKMIAIEENSLIFDNCYNISCFCNKKYYFKCDECNKISSSKKKLNDVTNRFKYSCEYCSDGISIPNKWIRNLLHTLNIDFLSEYNPFYFKNSNCKVDILISSMSLIIEMDGNFGNHIQSYDYWRDFLNMKYGGYKTIRVDLTDDKKYKNTFNYLKKETTISLGNTFDLSNIDWSKLWAKCQNSTLVKSCNLWNSGKSVKEIANIIDMNRVTVSKYLSQGSIIGICDYTQDESRLRAYELKKGKNNHHSSDVICITTKKLFQSQVEAMEYYNLTYNGISSCCRGERKYQGKLDDGTKLVWRYVKSKHNIVLRGNDICKLKTFSS